MSVKDRFVRVAVPKPLPQLFDYTLAAEQPAPALGARVRVPFGRQQLIGVCVGVDPPDPHPDPRPVTTVLDPDNPFGAELYGLAVWMTDYYQYPLGEVLAALLPAEARRGIDLTSSYRRPSVAAWALNPPYGPVGRAPRQRALIDYLQARGGIAPSEAIAAAGFGSAIVRGAASKGIIARRDMPIARAAAQAADRLRLNPEQDTALRALLETAGRFTATLLQGITGSGKTEVYLRLIESILARGQQALVLVPEIALTPQTLDRFRRRFGTAASLHSGMTDAQRLQVWLGCRAGDIDILVGTRSAVLTPFRRLGLIVVDEEHDASFKQQDGLRYSARDVAVKRAQGLAIPLLLGSATPSFESLVNAWSGRYRHLELTNRAGGANLPSFNLIDIRGHTLNEGISNVLVTVMRRHLEAGGQVLLYLNRRGYAPSFVCTGCGWQATCQRCDMRMTLHRDPAGLACHHCNQRARLPAACPACHGRTLLGIGLGTQRTEAGVTQLFPDVPVYRIDRDTARSQRRLESQFAAIHSGTPAILIGTQMLAKGHHFPNVTLVGVINADGGFLSADFRAPERTAQLIIQVAGRAGRAERPGEVWIQTYQPDNPALQSLIHEGYVGFARRELEHRRVSGLPPYRPMALVRAEAPDPAAPQALLQQIRDQLLTRAPGIDARPRGAAPNDAPPRDARETSNARSETDVRGAEQRGGPAEHMPAERGPVEVEVEVEVLGPVAAPIQRVANRYRFQLLVLADTRRALHDALRRIEWPPRQGRGLRWSLDIDPYDAH